MSQELQRRRQEPSNQRAEPSWRAVAGTTVRLWMVRHHLISERPASRRRRLVVVLSAIAAMAVGAGLTLAFTGVNQSAGAAARSGDPAPGKSVLQQATANRHQAAVWVATQVSRSEIVSCDPEMCGDVESSGFPAGSLMVLPSTAPDPMGSELVIATPAIQSQFGTRLASVYAPQVIASFGSGPEQVVVRSIAPDGAAAFDAQLATYRQDRITAGKLLLTKKNIHPSAAARAELIAGQVDPRLLVALSPLADKMSLHLIAFYDSSPGEGSAVPLRGAEISASGSAGLSAILAFLSAQQGIYAPAKESVANADGQQVVTVWFYAPGPLDVAGS